MPTSGSNKGVAHVRYMCANRHVSLLDSTGFKSVFVSSIFCL
jgi:hypothetical protein